MFGVAKSGDIGVPKRGTVVSESVPTLKDLCWPASQGSIMPNGLSWDI